MNRRTPRMLAGALALAASTGPSWMRLSFAYGMLFLANPEGTLSLRIHTRIQGHSEVPLSCSTTATGPTAMRHANHSDRLVPTAPTSRSPHR